MGWRATVSAFVLACAVAPPAFARWPGRLAQQNWQDYSPRQRYEALQNYKRHERLPEKRQEDIERNYQRWRSLPEQERNRIRENYQRYQQLPPVERDKLKRQHREPPEP